MKKAILFLSVLFLSTSIMAQEKVKQKEIGITFNNLNNLDWPLKQGQTNPYGDLTPCLLSVEIRMK